MLFACATFGSLARSFKTIYVGKPDCEPMAGFDMVGNAAGMIQYESCRWWFSCKAVDNNMDLDLRSTKLASFHEPLKLFDAGELHLTQGLSWRSEAAGARLTCCNNTIH